MCARTLVGALLLGSALFCGQAAAQMSAADAFNAGKVAGGEGARNDLHGRIGNSGAEGAIRGYSTTPPAASSYWTGNQTLVGPVVTGGTALADACSTGNLPSDPAEAQRCEAIRAIKKSIGDRSVYGSLIDKSDPLIVRGNAITADPEAVAGSISGAYSNCTITTQQSDQVFEYETCDEGLVNGSMTCSIGQEVVIDADHLYQCTSTLATLSEGQCAVGVSVVVDPLHRYQCEKSITERSHRTCERNAIVSIQQVGTCTEGTSTDVGTLRYRANWITAQINCIYGVPVHNQMRVTAIAGVANAGYNAYLGGYYWVGITPDGLVVGAILRCVGQICSIEMFYDTCIAGGCRNVVARATFPVIPSGYTEQIIVNWDNQCAALEARAQ